MTKESPQLDNPIPYEESMNEARRLLNAQEIVDPAMREEMINDLFASLARTNITDSIGIQSLSDKVQRLLVTDPLTDQQSGTLTRWMWEAGYWGQESYDETLFLKTAHWADIEAYCTSKKRWKTAWHKAQQANWEGDHIVKTYRGMRLSSSDVQNIYDFGVIPPGFYRYGT